MPKGVYKHKNHSEKTKKKISLAHLGRKRTEETKNKIRKSLLGHPVSKETLTKMSLGLKGKMEKEKHWNWQGGKSFEPYSIDWTETLKRSIRERDNYICQLCSQYGNIVHHIDYDKQNCDPKNLITLCNRCNTKVNFNRDYWIEYFKNI